TRFQVPVKATPWASEGKIRRAAVSSFGFGGTNFHLILEEAPGRVQAAKVEGKALPVAVAQTLTAPAAAPSATAIAATAKPAVQLESIYQTLVAVLCDRTGYAPAEIEPDFELEADLGIDTVKQAEIMASVRERYGLARDEKFRLADYPSLNAMARYVAGR